MYHSEDIKLGKRNYCPIIISVLSIIVFTITLTSFSVFGLSVFSTVFSNSVYADTTTSVSPTTSTINVTLSDGITIRVLDSTASTDLEDLVFDFIPTDEGTSTTKNAIVEVGTSNETGYTLYMQSDWEDHEGNKTTSLIHTTNAIEDSIPTRLDNTYPYWYYYNALSSNNKIIPEYGNPDTLAEAKEAVEADRTTVPVTVGVDTSIVSGTYRNKLVFTATANPLIVDYSLTLNSNGGYFDALNSKTTETDSVTSAASQASFVLSSDDHPLKSGYTFLGWSEDASATTADYKIGDTYEILADDAEGTNKTLYAVYGTANFWNIHYMQEMTSAICQTATKPTSSAGKSEAYIDTTGAYQGDTAYVAQRALYDIRDGKSYIVRRLADGNCWMTENLAYEMYVGEDYVGSKNDGSVFTFTATGNNANDNAAEIMNGNTKPYEATDQASGKTDTYWYYTWYAATAGAGQSSDANKDIDSSICPVHWKLPYNETSDQTYYKLISVYGSSYKVLDATPLNFSRLGKLDSGQIAGGNWAGYWVGTASSPNSRAYEFDYNSGGTARTQATDMKYMGREVRCVGF